MAQLSDTPVLTTERLIIRAPEPQDVDIVVPFLMADRAKWVGGGTDCDAGKAWRMYAIIAGHWVIRGYGTFVFCDRDTGRPIGTAGPWYPGNWPEQELGWFVWDPADEGKGIAFEAVKAIRAHAYRDLGWPAAVSYIAKGNARSRALAERLGCMLDEGAAVPYPDEPCWVFRHPGPEALT